MDSEINKEMDTAKGFSIEGRGQIKLKICGMRHRGNIAEVRDLNPDYLGFIFYPKSGRYFPEDEIARIPASDTIRNTAVFVDPEPGQAERILSSGKFKAVQLHGNEDPAFCRTLRDQDYEVIKAFGVGEAFDFSILEEYLDAVDYFLFDTKSPQHGGTGKSFSWEILNGYPYPKSYFLSGGIGPDNLAEAYALEDKRLYAVDLNSRFESAPGIKNITLLKSVLKISI